MRIIRINKGKAIKLPVRLVAVAAVITLTIKAVDWLPEPWSILSVIVISALLPGLWFATKVIMINEEEKTIFDGVWTMGLKFSKTRGYDAIEEIRLEKAKIKPTVFSISKKENILIDHEYRAFLILTNGDEYYLLSHPIKERVEEKLTKIRKKLAIN